MKITRRQLLSTTAALTLGGSIIAVHALAQTGSGSPMSKQAAQYQDQPHGQQSCGSCTNFLAPSGCKLVTGTVAANGWCHLFQAKSS